VAGLTLSAAMSVLATACSSSGSSGGGGGGGGSELTISWAEPPDTLNPATTGARDVQPIIINVFDMLTWVTPDGKVTPDLATSWKTENGGKDYTLQLRKGVKFHDGTPFNAASVVANVKYITDKSTQSISALTLLGPCTSASEVSEFVVQFHCSTPYAPLLAQLGTPALGIQSPAAIKKYGKDLGDHLVGTGPFSFVSYTPNQSVVLKRNPDYNWAPPAIGKQGPAKLSKITFHIVTSSQARVSEFQSGQSQLMQETPGVFYNQMKKNPQYTALPVPISGMGIFAPINTQKWPTSELAVRKAIQYAVDKVGAIQVADNGVFPASNTPLQKGTTGYDASLENSYPYDPAKAAATLTAAGWTKVNGFWQKDGRKLTLDLTAISSVPEYPLIAQAIQGYLRKAGMDASVRQLAVPAWLAANVKGDMNLTPLQFTGVDPDALHSWFLPKQYFNWSHYSDPTLTKLILQGQQITDQAQRQTIYSQVQKIIMDQALEMPIHQNIDLVVMNKNLKGVGYIGGGSEYFYAASLGG
jgi:peptide/nickel transport system substrate-binding protein